MAILDRKKAGWSAEDSLPCCSMAKAAFWALAAAFFAESCAPTSMAPQEVSWILNSTPETFQDKKNKLDSLDAVHSSWPPMFPVILDVNSLGPTNLCNIEPPKTGEGLGGHLKTAAELCVVEVPLYGWLLLVEQLATCIQLLQGFKPISWIRTMKSFRSPGIMRRLQLYKKPLSHDFPAKHRPSRSVYYSSPSPSRRLAKPTSHNRPANGKHEERWHVRTMAKLKHAECVSIVNGSFNFIGLALSTGRASRLRSCSMPRHAMWGSSRLPAAREGSGLFIRSGNQKRIQV